MKLKHPINLHKSTSFLFILGLMAYYQNFSLAPWVYLALHGTYGIMWIIKDSLYPDKRWEEEISTVVGIIGFFFICSYWVAPFILISSGTQPAAFIIAIAIAINLMGVFLHYLLI